MNNSELENFDDNTKHKDDNAESSRHELKEALGRLRIITSRVRIVSLLVVTITMLNVIFGALFTAGIIAPTIMLVSLITFFIFIVISLFEYDRAVSMGNAIFHEISDELEWHIRQDRWSEKDKEISSKDQPGLAIRLALREFVLASKLPFMGPAFYLSINIVILFSSIMIVRLFKIY